MMIFDQSVQGRMGGRGIAQARLEVSRLPRGHCQVQVRSVEGLYEGGRRKNGRELATTYMQDLSKRKEPKMTSRF